MDNNEFDATLGGSEHLPFSANSLRFAASRSIEIAAMTESVLKPSQTKLIFQKLPVHMRRRVMSHNCKRLPRKLRAAHLDQLKKSGLPPKQKRPSRKYRRRPANLLEEYNRRQRRNVWLETHIWHAKRFHMIERWQHRLANAPCDKAFRACYRATSAHCLMQDMSYYTTIKITGKIEDMKELFSNMTSSCCGLSVTAKAFISGNREGSIHLFQPNKYPLGYIGKVLFIWESETDNLWLFVHPSQRKEVEDILNQALGNEIGDLEVPEKRRKLNDNSNKVHVNVMPGSLNRFRLTGPNSHAILVKTLKCIEQSKSIEIDKWVSLLSQSNSKLHLDEKHKYWNNLSLASSPSQLPPHLVLGLIVRDPRLSRPPRRTKAVARTYEQLDMNQLINIPKTSSISPLWNSSVCDVIKKNKLTNAQYIEHVTKTQLVPGEVFENDPVLQSIPIVLVQRPGSQRPDYKKLGYGCGWDVLVPAGYGLIFWQTFIMFGARAGGLRETESLSFETGDCYLPPDSAAGKVEENRIESELADKYFRRPPSKRVNFVKLGINSPFVCQWKILLKDWCDKNIDDFFILRDKNVIVELQRCLDLKSDLPQLENTSNCLVPVYLHMLRKGSLKKHAVICMPMPGDSSNEPLEPHHVDQNEKIRRELKQKHLEHVKQIRRKKLKLKAKERKGTNVIKQKTDKQSKKEPSEYVKRMRQLWLPTNITEVRRSCSREVMGYLSQGAFSFSEAKSCGVGYIAYNALSALLNSGLNHLLVRNTCSRKYRLASIKIIQPNN